MTPGLEDGRRNIEHSRTEVGGTSETTLRQTPLVSRKRRRANRSREMHSSSDCE